MLKRIKNIIIVFTLILPFLNLNGQTDYEDFIIKNIKFEGNKSFSQKELLEQTALRGTNIIDQYILRKEPFEYSVELLNAALERWENFYQREGFLNAKVGLKDLIVNREQEIIKKLIIEVDEGDPYQVDTINYEIEYKPEVDTTDIQTIIDDIIKDRELEQKQRFRDEKFKRDRDYIINAFNQEGFIFVKVRYNLQLIQNDNRVIISWQIIPGNRCYFGVTEVKGNDKISSQFILEQLAYEKGYIFRESRLYKTQNNLYDLGLFRVVNVRGNYEDRTGNRIPVEIDVTEAPRLNTQIGLGYGTEDKFRAFVDLRRLNLFGGARRVEISARRSALEPYNVNLKWVQPQFLTRKATIIINPYIRHETEPGYETRRLGLNLPVSYKITKDIKSSLNYYMERVRQELGKNDPDKIRTPSGRTLYDKAGLLLDNEWKTSRPLFFPEYGFFAHLSYKVNGYFFQSDFDYTRLLFDFRKYQKIEDIVLAGRLKIGGIESAVKGGFVPVEDRFYAGGSMSIRGWSRAQLGPKSDSNPIGGKSLLETSFEVRHPIYKKLSGTVFTDIGNVWLDSYSYHLNKLRYSVGVGLRYRTPIGPVRLDISRPVLDMKKSFQIHINIGQAF